MLTVAMITKDEEGAVEKVITEIKAVVPEAEILIVDSSKDKTAEIAEASGARVIRQFPPQGYGRAMETALRSADGDVIVTLDCDDTYPVETIRELAGYVQSGEYDIVDGSRLERKPEAMPWINYLANWGFAWVARILFFRKITDLHSGMRAYSKKLINEMNFDPSGPALPVELLLIPVKMKKKVKFMFIDYRERIGDTTLTRPHRDAWWTLKRLLKVRFGRV